MLAFISLIIIFVERDDTERQDIAEVSCRDGPPIVPSVATEVVLRVGAAAGAGQAFMTAAGYAKGWYEFASESPLLGALALLWHLFDEIEPDG